ncbi:guanine nucleotide-binding protein-like 1 isoform X1 [Argiope bruennichi]|uniref:Guanine nucleotide-binding protein-like 1 n=1 Tax=Argiope bruennichi TaxID=94029 RepID=A0A8T0EH47_ARGBR|nr:guanine nucleotide-binding protein-like 1 isoform X1 [Argiope bruennichi]KAF8773110.1 Guanine nucleotide-binding protein-like 1 [Argiope bruennichi]
MPQGKRKVPFSAKQKKLQLQQKRERKLASKDPTIVSSLSSQRSSLEDVDVINEQPTTSGKRNPNRYRLVFKKEKNEDVKQRLLLAKEPFDPVPEETLEVSYEDVFTEGSELDMPKRPPWDFSLSKEELEMREQKYFREYIANLEAKFGDEDLSHFEMNLETWRQLWRVVEFSDIVLQVIDIRYPVYHFSPALYDYVIKDLKKNMILVLNKVDLVPAPLVLAWQEYFKKHFPMLKVMCFASYAGMILKEGKRGRRIGNLHMAITGTKQLLHLCEDIVGEQVNLSSWKEKISAEAAQIGSSGDTYLDSESEIDSEDEGKHIKASEVLSEKNDTSYYEGERYKDSILTIGFVGHPNVGKSSFLNAVCGKKVVSVSRTPGHTKHFQTIMLTKNVRLCDCPGLVFPSLVPKPIQVLMGCYPISQLREPYSAITYLGQRVQLPQVLKIRHPELEYFESAEEVKWSAYDICEAWAIKRGFRTARTARPDVYRAANNILRMALDGRTICLAFYPPNYTKEKAAWAEHPGLGEILAVQAYRRKNSDDNQDTFSISSELNSLKMSEDIEDYCDSESEDDDDSRNDEADSEDSAGAPTSGNKFDLLGEEVNC